MREHAEDGHENLFFVKKEKNEIATPDRQSGQARNDKKVAWLLAMTEKGASLREAPKFLLNIL
jgi:hypothetical protein